MKKTSKAKRSNSLPSRKSKLRVGDIWYHPLAGPGRPFVVRAIKKGVVYSDNLDDGAMGFKHPLKWVEQQERL